MSGTVTSDVECRFTESGIAVCRFRLTETPSQWDAATQKWRDGTSIPYACTAWRDLARNAAESLTSGVTVLVKGRITETKDNSVYLSVDGLGISLRQRIAYTQASLPSPATPLPATAAPVPLPRRLSPPLPSAPPHQAAQQSSGLVGTGEALRLVRHRRLRGRRLSPSRRPLTLCPFPSPPTPVRYRFACRYRALPERPPCPSPPRPNVPPTSPRTRSPPTSPTTRLPRSGRGACAATTAGTRPSTSRARNSTTQL
ncbi:single-stranded DNA-binding protein [Streptomyces sp. NPDC057413]|uniref:single-stranded DNA-binding protein n=1 Tax=Streptomyces sp. NPDC057413 TaxID=3346124 RepID=UPI00367C5CEC